MILHRLKYYLLLTIFLIPIISSEVAAQDLPQKPYPPRLVNDFAGMLNGNEINSLENKLVAFNDSTSTQIAIVTVKDLQGYDVADYAQRLAQSWGIGQQGLNNGMLLLVKPKTGSEKGYVAIEQGYGLEGAIPDITCAEIIDYEILPAFREGDYFGGLDKATTILMQLASGEFSADEYGKSGKDDMNSVTPFIIFIIFIVIVMFMRSSGGKNQKHISDKGLPLWLLLSMMNSGRGSHNGSWGGCSGGGDSGGFGGFGGGSFGGGGASGSW